MTEVTQEVACRQADLFLEGFLPKEKNLKELAKLGLTLETKTEEARIAQQKGHPED